MSQSVRRILIADDHPLFRGALRSAVAAAVPDSEISEAAEFQSAVSQVSDGKIDLILLDLAMPGVRGFSGLMYLRAGFAGIPIIVVSASDESSVVRRCMSLGASGFISKSSDISNIRLAVNEVLNGNVWLPPGFDLEATEAGESETVISKLAKLTPQQMRVLMMLSEGLLNKQIAYALSVSEATVKAHVSAILLKLGVESRTQAVIEAAKIDPAHLRVSIRG